MNKKPIFQSIFADSWEKLPSVMHKHYANRAYSTDVVRVEGNMDIEFGWFIRLLLPFLRLFSVLVPYKGNDIPVTVNFLSEVNSAAYCLKRTFNFPNSPPYIFFSRLIQIKDDIVVELMKSGIGWKHRFYYNGNKVVLKHRRYIWKLFGIMIPIPIKLFLGKVHAEEEVLSDNSFRMKMHITHPLLGKIYEYRGIFTVTEMML